MRSSIQSWLGRVAGLVVGVCLAGGVAAGASSPHYIVTNDDATVTVSDVSFYSIGSTGQLTLQGQVPTGGFGIGGGFFGANKIGVLNNGSSTCVYATDSASGDVVGIVVRTMKVGGRARGGAQDAGTSNGIGMAMNSSFLYAGFTDNNMIGTFQLMPGCKLQFVGDLAVSGVDGGSIDAMAAHGDMLIVTYVDGSIESFDISGGVPVSHGDKQNSTGANGAMYPNGIDITQDGHFAIFGDTATSMVIEVSDISSGKLTPTVVYHLGSTISASNILLSPDETLLYIANTQGDKITAAFFDKNTGKLTKGCATGPIKGYVSGWSYLGGLALQKNTGTGGTLYVAEFGAPSSIGVIKITSSGGTCTLAEAASSPVADPNSPGLLSIGSVPARSF